MIGRVYMRRKKNYEYDIAAKNISFTSDRNGIYSLETNNLDNFTPVQITDGGGVYII